MTHKTITNNLISNSIPVRTNDCDCGERVMGIPVPQPANYQLADIDLYNEWNDINNRVIYLPDEIDSFTMRYTNMIYRWVQEDEAAGITADKRKPLYIFTTGWGGDLYATYALISAMKGYGGKVITINQAVACSAHALIFINGTPGYRFMTKYSYILLHQGSGSSGYGSFSQQDASQKNYQRVMKMLEEIVLSNTKIDMKNWKKIQARENYYYLEDCLRNGICDKELTDISAIWNITKAK